MKVIKYILVAFAILHVIGELYARYVMKHRRFFDALAVILLVSITQTFNPISWTIRFIEFICDKLRKEKRKEMIK